jgi:hypothetical protein
VNGEIEAPILIIDQNSDLERVLKTHKEVVLNTPASHAHTKVFHHYVQNGILSIKNG